MSDYFKNFFFIALSILPWMTFINTSGRAAMTVLCLPLLTKKTAPFLFIAALALFLKKEIFNCVGGSLLLIPCALLLPTLLYQKKTRALLIAAPFLLFFIIHSLSMPAPLEEIREGLFLAVLPFLSCFPFWGKTDLLSLTFEETEQIQKRMVLSFYSAVLIAFLFCASFFPNPLIFGSTAHKIHLTMLLLLSLPIIVKEATQNHWLRILSLGAAFCILCLWTSAKTEVLALGMSYGGILVAVSFPRIVTFFCMITTVLYGAVILFWIRAVIESPLLSWMGQKIPSFYERLLLWDRAEHLIQSARYWGSGLFLSQKALEEALIYKPFSNATTVWFFPEHAHNLFIATYLAFGAVGLLLLIGGMLLCLFYIYKSCASAAFKAFWLSLYIAFCILTSTTYPIIAQPWLLSWLGIVFWWSLLFVPQKNKELR